MTKKNEDELKNIPLKIRVTETMKTQLVELADEMGISQNQVIENAFQMYYAQDVVSENIILGRMTQVQHQITLLDRKIETLSGMIYTVLPYILGTQPDLPKIEVDKNGNRSNPGLVKGYDILSKLISSYKKDWKTHKISFVQQIWADMQEDLQLTNNTPAKDDNESDRSN